MLSWGYVLQRACVLGVNITQQFSRITDQKQDKQQDIVEDNNGFSGLKITGRIVLDAWRLFRSEVLLPCIYLAHYHRLKKNTKHFCNPRLSLSGCPTELYLWKPYVSYTAQTCLSSFFWKPIALVGTSFALTTLDNGAVLPAKSFWNNKASRSTWYHRANQWTSKAVWHPIFWSSFQRLTGIFFLMCFLLCY